MVQTRMKDKETGCIKTEKIFNAAKFGQAVVFVLKDHEDRLNQIEDREKERDAAIQEIKKINYICNIKRKRGEKILTKR